MSRNRSAESVGSKKPLMEDRREYQPFTDMMKREKERKRERERERERKLDYM